MWKTAAIIILSIYALILGNCGALQIQPSQLCFFERRSLTIRNRPNFLLRNERPRTRSPLCTTATESHNDGSTDELDRGYQRCKYGLGATGAILLLMPDRTRGVLLASKIGGAAGFGAAAGLCHILREAHQHGRLSSDTYKRLNLGLLGFSALGLTAFPGEAAFAKRAFTAMLLSLPLSTIKILTAKVAWKGWKSGLRIPQDGTEQDIKMEIWKGTRETVRGLKVGDRKKSLTYRNIVVLLVLGMISAFMDGIFNIQYMTELNRNFFDVSLKWSAVSRLFMLATMVFSLKDAAERDRLAGTTFVQMNVMVGGWAVLVGLGQSITRLGFYPSRGVIMYSLSIPFLLRAYKGRQEKLNKRALNDSHN